MGRDARAKAATKTTGPVFFGVPFAKVDVEARTVTGIVTDELLDRQGDIVDFDTIAKFFVDEDLWCGNIREQHDPGKPVGSKVSAVPDPATKTVEMTAYISEACPDTWTKVLDRTLKGFSIGGNGRRVIEKDATGRAVSRLFIDSLVEVSLVDNPANPRALFKMAKADDGGILKAVEPLTVDEVAADEADDAEAGEHILAAADAVLEKAAAAVEPPAPVAVPHGTVRALLAGLFAAPRDARAAQKSAIVAQATEAGLVAELPQAWGGAFVGKGMPEPWDIDSAMGAVSMLEWLLQTEFYDARFDVAPGGVPDPIKTAQVALLKGAIDLILQFILSEHREQFTPDPAGTPSIVSDAAVVQLFASSLDCITKAGARHSKGDLAMIQKVHDLSGTLGAACKEMEVADDEAAEKALTPSAVVAFVRAHADDPEVAAVVKYLAGTPVEGVVLEAVASENVTKLSADLANAQAALAESKATVAKQAETVAALDARLQALEAQPMPGGPATRAVVVEKTVGGPTDTGAAPAPGADDVLKAIDLVAATAATDEERMGYATKKMLLMRQAGLGAVDPASGRPLTR